MINSMETVPHIAQNSHLQQLVQRLLEEYQSENEHVSHELYENIAQTLVAIKTQLVLLEKKLPIASPEFSNNIHQLDIILQMVLSQIRTLADGLYSSHLASLGLEDAIKELCSARGSRNKMQVSFDNRKCSSLPGWVERQHAICLYYFLDQALNHACKPGNPVFVSLECDPDGIALLVNFVQPGQPENPEDEKILPILQEWLHVWGGQMLHSISSDNLVTLSALMEARTTVLQEGHDAQPDQ